MSDNPPPGSTEADRVQQYRQLVLEYEALDEEIDHLLELHQGAAERMSASDLEHYRNLARRRDDIHNQIRELEQQIALDDENA
jgi:hypothetical protein